MAASPEQITAAATVWLAVFTLLLGLLTAALGIAAWRTYGVTKAALMRAKDDVDRQLASLSSNRRSPRTLKWRAFASQPSHISITWRRTSMN
jgi:hypothetical protein